MAGEGHRHCCDASDLEALTPPPRLVGVGAVVAGTVATGVLVAHVLVGPLFSLETKTWPAQRSGDRVMAAIEGVVKGIDVGGQTVRVASGFLGLASRAIVVDPQTKIAVDQKLGALADLEAGQLVRISYEVHSDRLLASRVLVLERGAPEPPFPTDVDPATLRDPAAARGARPTVPASPAPPMAATRPSMTPALKPAPTPPSPSLVSGRVTPPAPAPKVATDKRSAPEAKKRAVKPPVTAARNRAAEPRRSETASAAPRTVEPTSGSRERGLRSLDRDLGPR